MNKRMVETESGKLQGIFGWDPRITVFKGVPYAKAPVGELRWKAPQPVEPWDGIRMADQYGPISCQPVPGLNPAEFWTREIHPTGTEFEMSEDCLYLNIFTPARTGEENLPVLFYIHGGGYKGGYPYEVEFDWEHMARKGMVVVAVTYRLGVMGFFAHPWLREEDPEAAEGNFGLQDQLAAIRWVHRNIRAFGGNPDKITIAGQSAGAGSVQNLLSSPHSRGLIAGAIVESGVTVDFKDAPQGLTPYTLEAAEKNGQKLMELAGASSLEEARHIPAEDLVRIEDQEMGRGFHFQPVVDGKFLLETPWEAFLHDHTDRIPVIAGYNEGETKSFKHLFNDLPENMEDFEKYAERYGDRAEEFKRLCNVHTDEQVRQLFDQDDAFSDLITGTLLFGILEARQGRKAYLYQFGAEIPGDDAGAYHGCEMWFAYDSLARCWRPFKGSAYDLARQTSSYWTNFVKYGDPNGTDTFGEPLPEWHNYTAQNPVVMEFKDKPQGKNHTLDALMEFRMTDMAGMEAVRKE